MYITSKALKIAKRHYSSWDIIRFSYENKERASITGERLLEDTEDYQIKEQKWYNGNGCWLLQELD